MKPRHSSSYFRKLYTNPTIYVALLTLSYVLLLAISYTLGYLTGSSFTTKDIPTFVIFRSSKHVQSRVTTRCADPVPPQLIRQTIIDQFYDRTSPFVDFNPPSINRMKRWGSYGVIYKSLLHKVRPKTILKLGTFSGDAVIYMTNLTSQLGLETQILCLEDSHGWPRSHDLFEDIGSPNGEIMLLKQFTQNVISQNATESILPVRVPLSTTLALEKLCELGIYGDLIEIDGGRDFHAAWSNINRVYKLLRPGGVIFGHNYFTSYHNKGLRQAARLFARVNKFRFKADGQHWMVDSVSPARQS